MICCKNFIKFSDTRRYICFWKLPVWIQRMCQHLTVHRWRVRPDKIWMKRTIQKFLPQTRSRKARHIRAPVVVSLGSCSRRIWCGSSVWTGKIEKKNYHRYRVPTYLTWLIIFISTGSLTFNQNDTLVPRYLCDTGTGTYDSLMRQYVKLGTGLRQNFWKT
jgi:hypothetical protein